MRPGNWTPRWRRRCAPCRTHWVELAPRTGSNGCGRRNKREIATSPCRSGASRELLGDLELEARACLAIQKLAASAAPTMAAGSARRAGRPVHIVVGHVRLEEAPAHFRELRLHRLLHDVDLRQQRAGVRGL